MYPETCIVCIAVNRFSLVVHTDYVSVSRYTRLRIEISYKIIDEGLSHSCYSISVDYTWCLRAFFFNSSHFD